MPHIVTLTLNPAVDLATSVDRMEPVRKLRCSAGRRDPGGGGINVARVVKRLGADVTAVYPAGGYAGAWLERLIDAEGVNSLAVPIRDETREDVTVFEEASGQQYRFVLPGPRLDADEWAACLEAVATLGPGADFVCASGSLPPGVPDDVYAQLAGRAAGWGARLALDTSGAALKAALTGRVYLIKPSLGEMRELTGAPLDDAAARVRACRDLVDRGQVEIVALSLGAEGAMLVTADSAWAAPALDIVPVSTVGAGDSFLGAMVWALASGEALADAFRYAVAGGSAALVAPGTELCLAEDVKRLIDQVRLERLAG